MKKTKELFVFESNYIKNNVFNFIFLFAVAFIANGFFINRVNADTTSTFYVTSGVDTTDGVITPLTTTGGQNSEINKLSFSDDNRMSSNEAWPGGGVYDESKYIEFNFNPNLPSNSNILDVNLNFEYFIGAIINNAKIELYKNGAWIDIPIQLPVSTGTGGEISLNIDLSQYIQNISDLENLKIKFLAYRNSIATSAKTSHDLVSLSVTYNENITPPPPTTTFTEVTSDISTDTTWTAENSPYVINSYIAVLPGATLTIEPNTVVKFGEDGGLAIIGNIQVLGTNTNHIYFTSLLDDSLSGDTNGDGNATTPSAGVWSDIYIQADSPIALNNLEIRYSLGGMYVENTNLSSSGLEIDTQMNIYNSDGTFENLDAYSLGFFDQSNFTVDNSHLHGDDFLWTVGVYDGSIIHFNNTNIENEFVGGDTLYAFGGSQIFFDGVTINNEGNDSDGISIYGNGTFLDLKNSFIVNNDNSLSIYDDAFAKIMNTTFTCMHDCITLVGGFLNMTTSKVSGAGNEGIVALENPLTPGGILITKSEIYNNYRGIASYGADVTASMNNIHDNNVGAFNVSSDGLMDMDSNYWGDPTGPYHSTNPTGLGNSVTDNVSFVPWLLSDPLSTNLSNVLFIPGFEASRMYHMKSGLFGETEDKLWEPGNNSDALELVMNSNGESINPDIYTKDIIDEFAVYGMGTLNIYKSFIDSMDDLVENDQINAWEAVPYDWRLSPDVIVRRGVADFDGKISYNEEITDGSLPYMVKELNYLINSSKNGKVTIVTHSNGGLVAKALVAKLQEMKDSGGVNLVDSIDKIIFVAMPSVGTPKAIPALLHGHDQGFLGPLLLREKNARELGKNLPVAYNLLPSDQYFETTSGDPVIKFDESLDLIEDWRSVYGNSIDNASEMKDFLRDSGNHRVDPDYSDTSYPSTLNSSIIGNAENFHNTFDDVAMPSSIDVYQVAGFGIPTIKDVSYGIERFCNFSTALPCENNFKLMTDVDLTTDGDGTVVSQSALYNNGGKYYLNIREYNKNKKIAPFRNHSDIFEVPSVFNLVNNILNDNQYNLPMYVTQTKPSDVSVTVIKMHSPVSVDAYDTEGLHTGIVEDINPDNSFTEEQIIGSSYFEVADSKYLVLPSEGSYTVKIKGEEDGIFTLVQESIVGDSVIESTSFSEVPVTKNLNGEFDVVDGTLTSNIAIDSDGDEVFESSILPSLPAPYPRPAQIENNRTSGSYMKKVIPDSPILAINSIQDDLNNNLDKDKIDGVDKDVTGKVVLSGDYYTDPILEYDKEGSKLGAQVGVGSSGRFRTQILIIGIIIGLLFSIKFVFKVK